MARRIYGRLTIGFVRGSGHRRMSFSRAGGFHTIAVLPLLLAAAGCGSGNPGAGTAWPDAEWPVSTPEAERVDPAAIDSLVADIDAGRYGLIDHFLLIRNGRVIADHRWDHSGRYSELLAEQDDTTEHQYNYDHPAWHPYYSDTDLHSLQSVTKSVMSVAFGIAVDAGHIPGRGRRGLALSGGPRTRPHRPKALLGDDRGLSHHAEWHRLGGSGADL